MSEFCDRLGIHLCCQYNIIYIGADVLALWRRGGDSMVTYEAIITMCNVALLIVAIIQLNKRG